MKFTFWGTRGSIAAPGPQTVRVGGNTTCLEVLSGEQRMIIDAGTGIRLLGIKLMKNKNPSEHLTLLLTHSHWDHFAGFTFFPPAYHPDFIIDIYGNRTAQDVLRKDIFEREDKPYFPVNMDDFRAEFTFHDEFPNPMIVGDVQITTLTLNHPGNGFGFRFDEKDCRVVFLTDNEIGLQYTGGNTPQQIEAFCRGSDILIHDAQYLPEEIEAHRGWGHSTYEEVADLADRAGVRHVILTHHDPERVDEACFSLLEAVRRYVSKKGYKCTFELGIEGQSFTIP